MRARKQSYTARSKIFGDCTKKKVCHFRAISWKLLLNKINCIIQAKSHDGVIEEVEEHKIDHRIAGADSFAENHEMLVLVCHLHKLSTSFAQVVCTSL